MEIANGVYDELYVTRNINEENSDMIPDIWTYDTIFHAFFKGNLMAGNVNFTVQNTDFIRIKRRISKNFNWVYLYQKPINTYEDFTFEYFDYTARSKTNYEYAMVAVSGSVEGDFIVSSIKTFFTGLYIMEPDKYYYAHLDVEFNDQTQHRPASVIPTLGSKYPFVISNGLNNYKSGVITAFFVELFINNCEFAYEDGWQFRRNVNDFLFDNKPKLIKYQDGQMHLVAISGETISESSDGHDYHVKSTFEWTELGDCDDDNDLYENGFVNYRNEFGVMSS